MEESLAKIHDEQGSIRRRDFDLSLYLVLDPDLCGGLSGMVETVKQGIENGVTFVQLRSEKEIDKRYWYEAGIEIKRLIDTFNQEMCDNQQTSAPVTFVVNDHIDVALAIDADGVHIGQKDLPAEVARKLLGERKIIGLSVGNRQELAALNRNVVDYIGVGPAFMTSTKKDARAALNPEGIADIINARNKATLQNNWFSTPLPAVGIGGISAHNAASVISTGVEGVAVVSAICGKSNPGSAAKVLANIVEISKNELSGKSIKS